MRKLLALLLNSLTKHIFSQYDVSTALPLFLRGISLILIISIGSILYQFNDLSLVDNVLKVDSYSNNLFSFFLFKLFGFIGFKLLLWISLFSSIALFFLFLPFWILLLNACIYLMLIIYFPTFLSFQWDILLIETLFLSLLLVSPRLLIIKPRAILTISYLQVLPLILLMVRLFYHSGLVKLLSNDPLWLGQSVMDIHLFSQPLPHFLSYYFHRFIIQHNLSPFITQLMFVIELIVPFGLLIPTYRRISAGILIFFQSLIIFTGNYGFFNFLVIVILFLSFFMGPNHGSIIFKYKPRMFRFVLLPILSILIINSFFVIRSPRSTPPLFKTVFTQLRLFKGYGLFARMTTNQTRFNIYLSKDTKTWEPLKLHYYDDDGFPTMSFVQPYHPRIRWQLWFKFIYDGHYPTWYLNFIQLVAKNPHSLPSLLAKNTHLSDNYSYVQLCYQDIVFSLNESAENNYWRPLLNRRCHFYDVKSGSIFR